jgi:hypothetical protein
MRAILVHCMGRTPASMLVLAARLRIKFHTFIMNAAIIANDIERVVAALNS